MYNFADKLIDGTIGHIKYRNNVVTGVVAAINKNQTYDVYISNSDVAYPNVPTTVKNPDFEIGEAVEILIEYGNKEMPIIIGRAKKVAQDTVEDEINVLVTTLDAYSIDTDSAYLEGRIEEVDGYENVIRRGFYYGTSTSYGSEVYSTGSFEAGSYSIQVTGLSANTTYHFQAYAYDAYNDEHKGEDNMFTTSPFEGYCLMIANPNFLRVYTIGGDVYSSGWSGGYSFSQGGLAMDGDGYIYEKSFSVIKKYDANLSLITSKSRESASNWFEGITCGNDGYLYSFEGRASGYAIAKRNRTTLAIVEDVVTIPSGNTYNGHVCIDTSGYFYVCNITEDKVEKWESGGGKVASIYIEDLNGYNGLTICGNYLYAKADFVNSLYYMPLDLSSYNAWDPSVIVPYSFSATRSRLIIAYKGIAVFDSSRNLVYQKNLDPAGSYSYKVGVYNFSD